MMASRSTRSAKTSARGLIQKSLCDAEDEGAIPYMESNRQADISPFVKKKKRIVDYLAPPIESQNCKAEGIEGSVCLWTGPNGSLTCNKLLDSPDDLIIHILTDHSKWSVRGYVCHWKSCSFSHFNTPDEFKEHLKIHVIIAPAPFPYYPNKESHRSNNEDDADAEYKSPSNDEDYDPDYLDSSDEERSNKTIKKRKASKMTLTPEVATKRICHGNGTIKAVGENSPGSTGTVFSFFKFTCKWVVPFTMKGANGGVTEVTCMRKFSVLEESLDHLTAHHIGKLKSQKMEIKCNWEDCSAGKTIFESYEKLTEHVKEHTKGKTIIFNADTKLNESKQESSAFTKFRVSPVPVNKETSMQQNKPSSKLASLPKEKVEKHTSQKSRHEEAEVTSTPEVETLPVPVPTRDETSWISAVLRALYTISIKEPDHIPCPNLKLCNYCRFVSWKHRIFLKKFDLSTDPYEFTLFKSIYTNGRDESTSCYEFVDTLYDAITEDQASNHKTTSFRECSWFKSLTGDATECSDHPLRGNLVNLFPVLYKNCARCAAVVESWPTEAQVNLIIKLGAMGNSENIQYPDVLMVCGRVYNLVAVVSQTTIGPNPGHFYTYVKVESMWVKYLHDTSQITTEVDVFNSKTASIVIYTAKKRDTASTTNTNCQYYKHETCRKARDFQLETTRNETTDNATTLQERVSSPKNGNAPEIPISAVKPFPARRSIDNNFLASRFTHRQLAKDDSPSSLNSVLQALLQTGIPSVGNSFCSATKKCYYCKMGLFAHRILSNVGSMPVRPTEFSHYHKELEIEGKDSDPGVDISNILNEVISNERQNHNTKVAKYKFMIRLQKKCSCTMSFETYHWALSPERKNEYLLDAMAKCKIFCTQCNVFTPTQPIQISDNLIITIESNPDHPDAGVHYPDEWVFLNTRYFLSSVIVNDQVDGVISPSAYCKVFGKWYRYQDETVTPTSSCDVLGNRNACVLVYVSTELTPDVLRTAANDLEKLFKMTPMKNEIKKEPIV